MSSSFSRFAKFMGYAPRRKELDFYIEEIRKLKPRIDTLELRLHGTLDENPHEVEENMGSYHSLVGKLFLTIDYVPEREFIATRKSYNKLKRREAKLRKTLYRTAKTTQIPVVKEGQPRLRGILRTLKPSEIIQIPQIGEEAYQESVEEKVPTYIFDYQPEIPKISGEYEKQLIEPLPYDGKIYTPGSLDTREKLIRALQAMKDVEIEKHSGHRHGTHIRMGNKIVQIPDSNKIRRHYVINIFKELGIGDRLR